MKKNIVVMFIMLIFLCACKNSYTYEELMQNPHWLEKSIAHCENRSAAAECQVVNKAADDMMKLINEMQQDPQQFGLKIMQAEREFVSAQKNLQAALQAAEYASETKNTPNTAIQTADDTLTQAQTNYQKSLFTMNTLLTAIAMNKLGD